MNERSVDRQVLSGKVFVLYMRYCRIIKLCRLPYNDPYMLNVKCFINIKISFS